MNDYLSQMQSHAAHCLQAHGFSGNGAQQLANGRPLSDPSDLAMLGTPGLPLVGTDLYGRPPLTGSGLGPGLAPNPDFQSATITPFPGLPPVPTPFLGGHLIGHAETLPENAKAALNHAAGWEPIPGVPFEGDPNSHQESGSNQHEQVSE